MNQDEMKASAARAALEFLEPRLGRKSIVGIGTGSTANCFIDALAGIKHKFDATVASSEASADRLRSHGIPVLDLNAVPEVTAYVDGADEVDPQRHLIKGGGGALTREKIVAAASKKFVCIADQSKKVGVLGAFPLPIEVIPLARSLVARQLVALGGQPEWRQGFTTDNGNWILDVHNMDLVDPVAMEKTINNLAGVVTCGLFAMRPADLVLMSTQEGIKQI